MSSTDDNIMVSVSCLTFNHAPYIRQCLDGFLMQKTNFKFEVLIHDDASTDGTEEIIREYEKKHPDIIKPLYEETNQYVLGRRGSKTFNYPRAKGKYIALCEGDDYWTDPLKLQKQVDFLEANINYGLSNTDSDVFYQESGLFLKNYNKRKRLLNSSGSVTPEMILSGRYFIKTASVVVRKDIVLDYLQTDYYKNVGQYLQMGDTPLWTYTAIVSKIHYLPESTTVYRRSKGTISNSQSVMKNTQFYFSVMEMIIGFKDFFNIYISNSFWEKTITNYNNLYLKINILGGGVTAYFPEVFLLRTHKLIAFYKNNRIMSKVIKSIYLLQFKIFIILQDISYYLARFKNK